MPVKLISPSQPSEGEGWVRTSKSPREKIIIIHSSPLWTTVSSHSLGRVCQPPSSHRHITNGNKWYSRQINYIRYMFFCCMMLYLLWTVLRSTEHIIWMIGLKHVSYSIFTGVCHVNTIDSVTVWHEVKGPLMHIGLTETKRLSSEQPIMYLLPWENY